MIDKTSKKNTLLTTLSKTKSNDKNYLSPTTNISSPQFSESIVLNSPINQIETDSSIKDFSKQSSIYSNEYFDISATIDSSAVEYRQRNQLTNLLSLDYVQSPASFIYSNIRIITSGYYFNRKNAMENNSFYVFSNTSLVNKPMPLVFLGSEYFLRKSINFQRQKYPLSTNETLEPLVDLFLNRAQFIKEIPELSDLSNYIFLSKSVRASIFFDSTSRQAARHLCYELRSKENQNKFTIQDLMYMSQRENNIIQINALNDKRYHELINQLTTVYHYEDKVH